MKTLFYGTPEVAVPFLELLARRTRVAAALSQPDKPAGRGLSVAPTPVKAKALALGLKVFQPQRLSEAAAELKALAPDLAVAVAYGKLLKRDLLDVPRLGTLNVHFSLLPKYRGAAPAQWALVRGESQTGVTVFWLDEGMDTGPLFVQKALPIDPGDDAESLLKRLQALGLEALAEALDELEAGRVRRQPQAGEPSLAPLIKREDARLSLERPAAELHDLVRGMRLWPRAFLELESGRLQVLKSALGPREAGRPGTILRVERGGGILVQCGGSSSLWFLIVQPEGKNPVGAADFLNGLRLRAGAFLPLA